jgi:hypothetical protein
LSRRLAALTTSWIEITAGLLALGIGIYQLTLPNVFAGVLPVPVDYDEGVYVSVSIRLVHGVLPYRDFVAVHPPGIALLMSPVAIVGVLAGSSASTLILARVLTLVVVAVNAVLAGRLVRPVGKVAVAVASFSLALWPLSVSVDRNLELEPYLTFFCLVGALLLFGVDGEPSKRRSVLGGIAFGCAFVVKVWAFMPIVAVVLVLLPRWRHALKWVCLGVASAIFVTCLPFFIAAPHAFVHDVFADQLFQQSASGGTSFGGILLIIWGLAGLTVTAVPSAVAVIFLALLVVAVALVYGVGWRLRTRLEWYILASAVVTFLGMLNATYFGDHYGYFPLSMIAPLLGVCAGRLWGYVHLRKGRLAVSAAAVPRVIVGASVVLALGAVAFVVEQDASYDQRYTAGASSVSALDSYIPPGACVLSDMPAAVVMANRITPDHVGCPADIDPYGMYLSYDDGSVPHVGGPFPAAFKLHWFSNLEQADFVLLRTPFSQFIPWTSSTIAWFKQNYVEAATVPTNYGYPLFLYKRVGGGP